MCGISGWIADPPLPKRTARSLSRALLYYSRERGKQSSGIYLSSGRLLKGAEDANTFIMRPGFNALFNGPIAHALMHTRQPTSGGTGDAQAQPFQHGTTVSVHNGMLMDSVEVAKEWGLTKHAGVDSELVVAFVEAYGIKRLPDFLAALKGPSATATVHEGKLYLYRDNNPTCFITLELPTGGKLCAFASTSNILLDALKFVWLMGSSLTTTYVPADALHEVQADGLVELVRSKPKPYYTSSSNHWDGSYCQPGVKSSRPDLFIDEKSKDGKPSKAHKWLKDNPNWKEVKPGTWEWVGAARTPAEARRRQDAKEVEELLDGFDGV